MFSNPFTSNVSLLILCKLFENLSESININSNSNSFGLIRIDNPFFNSFGLFSTHLHQTSLQFFYILVRNDPGESFKLGFNLSVLKIRPAIPKYCSELLRFILNQSEKRIISRLMLTGWKLFRIRIHSVRIELSRIGSEWPWWKFRIRNLIQTNQSYSEIRLQTILNYSEPIKKTCDSCGLNRIDFQPFCIQRDFKCFSYWFEMTQMKVSYWN